jgi:hypothetical protein
MPAKRETEYSVANIGDFPVNGLAQLKEIQQQCAALEGIVLELQS